MGGVGGLGGGGGGGPPAGGPGGGGWGEEAQVDHAWGALGVGGSLAAPRRRGRSSLVGARGRFGVLEGVLAGFVGWFCVAHGHTPGRIFSMRAWPMPGTSSRASTEGMCG